MGGGTRFTEKKNTEVNLIFGCAFLLHEDIWRCCHRIHPDVVLNTFNKIGEFQKWRWSIFIWLVSTELKNISRNGNLPQIETTTQGIVITIKPIWMFFLPPRVLLSKKSWFISLLFSWLSPGNSANVTFLGWENVTLFNGCWWPPTFVDEKVKLNHLAHETFQENIMFKRRLPKVKENLPSLN